METGGEQTQDTAQKLATLIRQRRLALGLSLRQAAETAGIARNTWSSAEDGSRRTADTVYAAIERTLRWTPGSVIQVKDGGYPGELPQVKPSTSASASDADEALIRVMRSDIPDEAKARIVRALIDEQRRARQRWLAMVDELIAETPHG